ncbi:hypothetical protein HI850_007535 [bacterium SPL81]|nr:hypothetical protein [Acinetobacter baumannii]
MGYKLGDRIQARNPLTQEIIDLIAKPNHKGVAFFDKNDERRFLQDGIGKLSWTNCPLKDAENPIHWDIL